jgi:hypothetical protein
LWSGLAAYLRITSPTGLTIDYILSTLVAIISTPYTLAVLTLLYRKLTAGLDLAIQRPAIYEAPLDDDPIEDEEPSTA